MSLSQPPHQAEIQACLDEMGHRGPDDQGLVSLDQICLGHRRLSIIDLSTAARQPFVSSCGNYYLVYNGEIYNYVELRQTLNDNGVQLRTSSDTEVLLQLLVLEGEACLSKLNGMFAFAFYDARARRLLMARDRFGKKPLYFHHTDNEVIFASELYPLKHFGKLSGSAIDQAALQSYFAGQFVDGERTIYDTIKQLPAASYFVYERGKTTLKRYWELTDERTELDFGQAQQQFAALLDDAVRIRMRADVPLGTFLSGGLDSSIITSLMLDHSSEVNSYSMGFEDASYDESEDAVAVATHLGSQHLNTRTALSKDNLLPIVRHLGQPMSDPSVLPFWELCKTTRQHVTVALSGDGADEVLGGYKRYLAAQKLAPLLKVTPAMCLQLIERMLPDSYSYYGDSRTKQLKLIARLGLALKSDHRLSPTLFLNRENAQLLKFFHDLPPDSTSRQNAPIAERMMFADLGHYLPHDILVKVDRMSMAHSLEIRCPFLDYRVVELAASLPLAHKIRGSTQKALLRAALGSRLPRETIRKAKHGFAVPVSQWLATNLKSELQEYIEQAPELISKTYCRQLLAEHCAQRRDHGLRLWSIYVFFLWFQHCRI